MIYYKLAARPNPQKPEEPIKVYASAVSAGTLTMERICENIERNSTATRGDVKGIALALSNYIATALISGKSVKIEDLGFFRVGCQGNGQKQEKDVKPTSIRRQYINYQPIGKLAALKDAKSLTFQRVGQVEQVENDEDYNM